jgi:hypothetical protein
MSRRRNYVAQAVNGLNWNAWSAGMAIDENLW